MNQTINRFTRGLRLLFKYVTYEAPRGLDISLRKISHRTGRNNGYAVSEDEALEFIFNKIDTKDKGLIDIGGGKGNVVINAVRFNFGKIASIEVSTSLHNTAK